MMNFNLVSETDPILKQVQLEMDLANLPEDLDILSQKMIEDMLLHDGIGLAAPQVGLPYRMFVMVFGGEYISCVNPKIIWNDNYTILHKEGCLSFPGLTLKVKRPQNIKVKYYQPNGEEHVKELSGLSAICFQHELDHLNGITFDTKIPKLSLKLAKQKRSKIKMR